MAHPRPVIQRKRWSQNLQYWQGSEANDALEANSANALTTYCTKASTHTSLSSYTPSYQLVLPVHVVGDSPLEGVSADGVVSLELLLNPAPVWRRWRPAVNVNI